MSTADGGIRIQARPSAEHTAEVRQQKPTQPPTTYFPLGYKDAAYQWVSLVPSLPSHHVARARKLQG